jgi:hypothetical protein
VSEQRTLEVGRTEPLKGLAAARDAMGGLPLLLAGVAVGVGAGAFAALVVWYTFFAFL